MIEISVLFIRACTMLSKLHNVNIHEVDITSFIKFNRNTIYVISEKIKNLTGDHERHSEFA